MQDVRKALLSVASPLPTASWRVLQVSRDQHPRDYCRRSLMLQTQIRKQWAFAAQCPLFLNFRPLATCLVLGISSLSPFPLGSLGIPIPCQQSRAYQKAMQNRTHSPVFQASTAEFLTSAPGQQSRTSETLLLSPLH